MKLDLTKLPVGEAMIGFLIAALAVSFYLAFNWIDDSGANEVVEPTATSDGGETATPGPGDGETEIVMHDNSFDPDSLTVTGGETVTFTLTNEGSAVHNMHVAGPNGDYSSCEPGSEDPCSEPDVVRGGGTATLTWDVPATPGEEVPFRCDFHPQDMTGTITVQ